MVRGWEKDVRRANAPSRDRKSTRLNSSHLVISYAVFCLKKKKHKTPQRTNSSHLNHTVVPHVGSAVARPSHGASRDRHSGISDLSSFDAPYAVVAPTGQS